MNVSIAHNGIKISVEDWKPYYKKPVLVVRIGGDKTHYKVASFDSEEKAEWFKEILDEFFKDIAKTEVVNGEKDS